MSPQPTCRATVASSPQVAQPDRLRACLGHIAVLMVACIAVMACAGSQRTSEPARDSSVDGSASDPNTVSESSAYDENGDNVGDSSHITSAERSAAATNQDSSGSDGDTEASGHFSSARGEIERSIRERGDRENMGADDPAEQPSRDASQEGGQDAADAALEAEGNLRVVAWPEPAPSYSFRALEESDGVFQTAEGNLQPWMFVFSMRNGTDTVSGLYVDVPVATEDAALPSVLYMSYTAAPIDVSRASFRSVLRVSQQLGSADISDYAGERVYLEFEEPVRAAIFIVQVSAPGAARMVRIGAVDAATLSSPAREHQTVAVQPFDDELLDDSGVVLVPAGQRELPSVDEPIDAMEEIQEAVPNGNR